VYHLRRIQFEARPSYRLIVNTGGANFQLLRRKRRQTLMARPIEVSIPHALGKDEARRRIEQGFGRLRTQMTGGLGALVSFQEQWAGDQLEFEGGMLGQKVRGRLTVLADAVRIQVDLPEMLAAIADKIRGTLEREGQKLLEKK
jgi:hypothetical protein